MAKRGWTDSKGRNFRSPLGREVQRLQQLSDAAKDTAGPVLGGMGQVLVEAIKRKLSTPGRGKRYKRGRTYHVASKPGDPPAVDRGHLRNSVGMEVVEGVLRVGAAAAYAPELEYGGYREVPGGVAFLAPRPFMRPALQEVRDRMTETAVVALRLVGSDGPK